MFLTCYVFSLFFLIIVLVLSLCPVPVWDLFSVGEFQPQELANLAWACVSAGRSDSLLFAALAMALEWG